jgi:cytochrome P450
MASSVAQRRPFEEINVSTRAFWSLPAAERERSFSTLRKHRPVSWQPPFEHVLANDPNDAGYWAVVRHADIVDVSRRHDVFVSSLGVMFESLPEEISKTTQSFLVMDPPQHTKIRRLVSAAFTPKQVRRIEDQIKANAESIVRELAAAGSGADFVRHCAGRLPLRTLSDMVGIPPDERDRVVDAAEAIVSVSDPAFLDGRPANAVFFGAMTELKESALTLAEQRRMKPADDLMTNLVLAEVDGQRLTDDEIASFFLLLAVAGNDTTRQTTSHALKALTDYPDQREWLMADLDGRIGYAVEEFVRWATPVMSFRRTAVADFELNGQHIRAGDKVGMFYTSGNRDAEVFAHPDEFDLSRDPNPHIGFGGGGVHFCLGNQVARTQLRAIFRELLHQLPDIRAGEPQYLLGGNFVHAIRSMPWQL